MFATQDPMLGPPLTDAAHRGTNGWWHGVATGKGIVVPDGAIDVMWTPGEVPWIAGPDTKPRASTLAKGTTVLGVRLRPGAAQAMVRQSAATLTNESVSVSDFLSPDMVDEVFDAAERASTSAAAAHALALMVGACLPADWEPDPAVVAVIDQARDSDQRAGVHLSERQLRRRFTQSMGYGPAFYRRIVRLDRFSCLLDAVPARCNAQLAAQAGYFDEAHLWRDATALTGTTPSQMREQLTG